MLQTWSSSHSVTQHHCFWHCSCSHKWNHWEVSCSFMQSCHPLHPWHTLTARCFEVSSMIFALRSTVLCHFSSKPCKHPQANHQNVDPGMLSEVLLKRKVTPFLTHPGLQVLYWLFFSPWTDSAQMCALSWLGTCVALGKSRGQEFHPAKTHAGRKLSADSYHKHPVQSEDKLFSFPQLKPSVVPTFHEAAGGSYNQ